MSNIKKVNKRKVVGIITQLLCLTLILFYYQNCSDGYSVSSTQFTENSSTIPSAPLPLPPAGTCPPPPTGRTLYVNATTGNDATTYEANSLNNPWRTIRRAAKGSAPGVAPVASQAAQAGDLVLITQGIYWEEGEANGGRFTVNLNPINSGAENNPIVFRGVGQVEVRLLAGFRGAMIGCNNREHIVWDHLFINDYYGGSTPDTGPVVFSGNARHCQIINSEITGHPGTYFHGYPTFGANYRGISLEPTHNIIIRNNIIRNFTGGQNEAGIMAYDSNDNIIENNVFYDSGVGIFIKGVHPGQTQQRNIIRKNVFYNHNYAAIRVLGSEDAQVYQNVIFNNPGYGLHAGFTTSARSRFFNNTLYNNGTGIHAQGAELIDVWFRNNIVVGSTQQAIFNWSENNPAQQDVTYERNLYFDNARHGYYEGGVRNISFLDWQNAYQKDQSSILADPLFMNISESDFRLQEDSPARQLGQDLLDLNANGDLNETIPAGAYITGDEIIGNYSRVCN